MTRVHVRLWGLLLLAALLALGTISPTFAAPPVSKTFEIQESGVLADCGNFQVVDDYAATIVVTDFYDNDGNLVEIHTPINGTDTYRQSVTGQSITMPSHF